MNPLDITIYEHRVALTKVDGRWWIMSPEICMAVAAIDGPFIPPRVNVVRAHPAMLKAISSVPSTRALARKTKDPDRVEIGPALINAKFYRMATGTLGPAVEWRATKWWEPVYALVGDEALAIIMGVSRSKRGAG